MDDYEVYLSRAYDKLPDIKTSDERFVIPDPKVFFRRKNNSF
jgi:translation initiation factor 2 subunit 2